MGASGTQACRFDLPECGGIYHLQAPIYEHKRNIDGLIAQAETTIKSSTSGKIGGFIFESLQGYGGIHVLDFDYLRKMAALTHAHGGLVIADEIQTGLGRMGASYWAYQVRQQRALFCLFIFLFFGLLIDLTVCVFSISVSVRFVPFFVPGYASR